MNSTNNLDDVAIIDLRGPDPGAFHDAYRSWAIRARLEREHGTSANHVIWFGAVPLMGDPNYATEGMLAMDRWLAAVESDQRHRHARAEDHPDRPADVNDRCSQIAGLELVSLPGVGTICELKDVQTRYGTPRTVAGEGDRDRHQQVHAQAAAAPGLLPDRRSPTASGSDSSRRSRPASATGAGPGSTRWTRSRGRPTRTAAAASSTAAGRSAPHRRAPAAAGRATRSRPGAGEGLGAQ